MSGSICISQPNGELWAVGAVPADSEDCDAVGEDRAAPVVRTEAIRFIETKGARFSGCAAFGGITAARTMELGLPLADDLGVDSGGDAAAGLRLPNALLSVFSNDFLPSADWLPVAPGVEMSGATADCMALVSMAQ